MFFVCKNRSANAIKRAVFIVGGRCQSLAVELELFLVLGARTSNTTPRIFSTWISTWNLYCRAKKCRAILVKDRGTWSTHHTAVSTLLFAHTSKLLTLSLSCVLAREGHLCENLANDSCWKKKKPRHFRHDVIETPLTHTFDSFSLSFSLATSASLDAPLLTPFTRSWILLQRSFCWTVWVSFFGPWNSNFCVPWYKIHVEFYTHILPPRLTLTPYQNKYEYSSLVSLSHQSQ